MAIALQENVLFATTIGDNIAYAAKGVCEDDIRAAATVACADAFIESLPGGYETELGERGGRLSAGQRQRITIARAIVRDTPVLILDEPTASLDAETEQEVLGNLAEWGRDRVLFLITHRLSTICNADQIAFLEDGRIKEIGAHETLMALSIGGAGLRIGMMWIHLQGNVAVVRRVFFFMDLDSEDELMGLTNLTEVREGVWFEHVDFIYPNRAVF